MTQRFRVQGNAGSLAVLVVVHYWSLGPQAAEIRLRDKVYREWVSAGTVYCCKISLSACIYTYIDICMTTYSYLYTYVYNYIYICTNASLSPHKKP